MACSKSHAAKAARVPRLRNKVKELAGAPCRVCMTARSPPLPHLAPLRPHLYRGQKSLHVAGCRSRGRRALAAARRCAAAAASGPPAGAAGPR